MREDGRIESSLGHFSNINVIQMDINIKRVSFLILEKVTVRAEKASAHVCSVLYSAKPRPGPRGRGLRPTDSCWASRSAGLQQASNKHSLKVE